MRPELGTLDMVLAQAAVSDPLQRLDAEHVRQSPGCRRERLRAAGHRAGRGEVPLLSQYRPSEPRNSVGFRPPSPDQITGATAVVSSIGRTGAPRHARPADEWVATSSPAGAHAAVAATTTTWTTPVCRSLADWCSSSRRWSCSSWRSAGASPGRSGSSRQDNSVPNFVGVNLGRVPEHEFHQQRADRESAQRP